MASFTSNSDCWTQYTMESCSPCSSGLTVTCSTQDPHTVSPGQSLTIMLPNLIDRLTLAISDLENFVAAKTSRYPELTISHLLIYLFSTSTDSAVTHINNIKLIHKGRLYSIQRVCDLSNSMPLIRDSVQKFPTFQLITSPLRSNVRLEMSVEAMLAKLSDAESKTSSSVTYAEAMVKLFKNTIRKSSVGSMEPRSVITRLASESSATDVESNSGGHDLKCKLKSSFKQIFKRDLHNGRQTAIAASFLASF